MPEIDRYWVVAEETDMPGMLACNPLEFEEDGRVRIMSGLTLLTDLDGLKKRGAKKVWLVDDIYDYANPRVLWEVGPAND